MSYAGDADAMLAALRQTLNWERARGDLDNATVAHILSEAARTAEHDIAPLDIPVDRDGALFEAGRVRG